MTRLFLLAGLAACQPRVCPPGATQDCVCPGASGAQVCEADGSAWGACACPGVGAQASGPTPEAVEQALGQADVTHAVSGMGAYMGFMKGWSAGLREPLQQTLARRVCVGSQVMTDHRLVELLLDQSPTALASEGHTRPLLQQPDLLIFEESSRALTALGSEPLLVVLHREDETWRVVGLVTTGSHGCMTDPLSKLAPEASRAVGLLPMEPPRVEAVSLLPSVVVPEGCEAPSWSPQDDFRIRCADVWPQNFPGDGLSLQVGEIPLAPGRVRFTVGQRADGWLLARTAWCDVDGQCGPPVHRLLPPAVDDCATGPACRRFGVCEGQAPACRAEGDRIELRTEGVAWP